MKENSLVLYSSKSSAILLRWVKHNEAQNKNSAEETNTRKWENVNLFIVFLTYFHCQYSLGVTAD